MNGILNIYKEKGFTSHDVVAKLRGILHQKKIGHTGTLDPQAEGVLPVCLGNATKLCDLLTDKTKEYEAVLLLGLTTDTQDAEGKVLSEGDPSPVTAEQIRDIIMSFVGKSEQIPPMYSALKVGGKKLYELARQGIEVERKPRPIEIFRIEINKIDLPRVRFTVECSKGTYIRTLCHDMGQKAGCGGIMESLLRTRVDRFALSDALKLSEIEDLAKEGRVEEVLIPVDAVFEKHPAYQVFEQYRKALENGNVLSDKMVRAIDSVEEDDLLRIYDEAGRFYGLYERKETGEIKPVKMFLG